MNSRNLPSVWSVGNFFIREDCKNYEKKILNLVIESTSCDLLQ